MKLWHNQLKEATKRIQQTYLPLVEKCATRHGSGIGIFKYLWDPKRDGTNCIFRYCIKNGTQWTKAQTLSRSAFKRLEAYTPETMIAIAILIPTSFYPEAKLIGDVYLYTFETYMPVCLNNQLKPKSPCRLRGAPNPPRLSLRPSPCNDLPAPKLRDPGTPEPQSSEGVPGHRW